MGDAKGCGCVSLRIKIDHQYARADGRQMVAAQPSAKFIVSQATPTPVQMTLWVGPQGYPIRLDTADGRTSIRYSRYDDPELTIEPPK